MFRYGAKFRPVGFATVPEGYTDVRPSRTFAHGIVVYPTELDVEAANTFQLTYIPSEEECDKLADTIADSLRKYAEEYLEQAEEEPEYFRMLVMDRAEKAYGTDIHVANVNRLVQLVKVRLGYRSEPHKIVK